MDTEHKAFDIKDSKHLDVKSNTKMAEWTKDIFYELNQKLNKHFQNEKNQSDENIRS